MNILALDTALGACSVAAGTGDGIRAARFELRQRGHAEAIMDMINHVCHEAGTSLQAMDVFVTTTGPGTFTGVRVGLSVARGLALSLDRVLLGFSTLEVIAWGALPQQAVTVGGGILFVVHDARRGEIYGQIFKIINGRETPDGGPKKGLKALISPMLMTLEQAGEEAAKQAEEQAAEGMSADTVMLVGSGAKLVADICPYSKRRISCPSVPVDPDARTLVLMAAQETGFWEQKPSPRHYRDGQPVAPLYLRAPDAKLPGKVVL